MEPVELIEDDLLLRPWKPSDADAVHDACQDLGIARWTLLPSPYRLEDAQKLVTERCPKYWADGTATLFGVFDRATGELLGSNGLVRLDLEAGEAEIGYWMAVGARRRGVAYRSSRAVARWAFDELKIQRLAWSAAPGNPSLTPGRRASRFPVRGDPAQGVRPAGRRPGQRLDGRDAAR